VQIDYIDDDGNTVTLYDFTSQTGGYEYPTLLITPFFFSLSPHHLLSTSTPLHLLSSFAFLQPLVIVYMC
jgi:hypothetical protein